MRHPALTLGAFTLFLLTEFPLAAQYPPGGYPPGGYPPGRLPGTGGPGLPFPRRGKKSKTKEQKDQQQLASVEGMFRQLDDKFLVIEAQDTRIISLKRGANLKFLKDDEEIKSEVLKPGDHLLIEYTQDDEGYLTAVNLNLQKEGTAEERARASEPVDVAIQEARASESNGDERPVQRRRDAAPETKSESGKDAPNPPAPQPAPKTGTPAPSATPATESLEAPKEDLDLNRIPVTPKYQPIDDTDTGPPQLKRGKPAAKKSAPPQQVALSVPPTRTPAAVSAPPASARETASAAASSATSAATSAEIAPRPADAEPRPEPVAETGPPPDPRIEKARGAAATFTDTLPDYVCTEQMARFVSMSHVVDWRPLDIVSAELVYEKGRERYGKLAINGKPTKKSIEELPGAWSTGEFGTVLVDLFSPATAADFRHRKESKIANRDVSVFDFDVDHEHSHWHIHAPSQSVLPAYRGSIWIDKETGRVLRIEMLASRMPQEFPYDKVESATDYEYIRIGEGQFLLPVHSETLMCERGTNICSRNAIDFRNYHKYAGEATIIFGK